MVLGEWIGKVVLAGSEINENLALAHTISKPIPAHVHGFRPFLLHSVIGKARGGGVVYLKRGWPLRVPQFFECRDYGNRVLAI
jgi:hypothetical protein